MTYLEYKNQRQAEFNALPVFFAFSNEQFKNAMEERGLTENDTDKIYSLPGGCGGFYLRSDSEQIKNYFLKHDPLDTLLKNSEFAEDAFYYEMGNHEYHINLQANWDVCSCFGHVEYNSWDDENEYFKQLGWEPQTIEAYKRAKKRFLQDADERGWY